jgi:hypothetical protein
VLHDECFALLTHILDNNSGEPENLFQRCRSLSWTFVNIKKIPDVDLAARTFLSASFPALKYMTIENLIVWGQHPRTGSPRLPKLKEVTLIDHLEECTPPFFHDDDFTNTEKLTFITTFGCQWMHYDITCIRRFRNLRILILGGEDLYRDDDMEALDGKPVELSLLETLTLFGNIPCGILILIRTPGLRKLKIEADNTTGRHLLVASNLVHFVGSLERLCMSLSEDVHETFWVEELE